MMADEEGLGLPEKERHFHHTIGVHIHELRAVV